MPVEERLRHALTDQAMTLRVDAEGPLAEAHRRRGRATAWKAAAAAIAVVAVVAGTTAVLGSETDRPTPAGPPEEPTSAPADPIPFGSYVRTVTVDAARDAGLPRGEVEHLFDGGEQVRVVMQFRDPPDSQPRMNPWVVRFVDDGGKSRVRDGGSYFYDDGELTVVSKGIECLGCNYHFTYDADHGRLTLDPTRASRQYVMAALLGSGSWKRVQD